MEIIEDSKETLIKKERYAGFWLRLVAYIIDELLLGVVRFLIFSPFIFANGVLFIRKAINDDLSEADLYQLGGLILGLIGLGFILYILKWLYYALMESSKYQGTLGKIALGLIVTDLTGERVSFARATGRFFARILTNWTLFIGYIIAGFTEKKQALHDIIASCLVLRK